MGGHLYGCVTDRGDPFPLISYPINVVDPLSRKGYRFKGTARVTDAGAEFDEIVTFFRMRGVAGAIRAAVIVRVEWALPVSSPAYDTGATEDELREHWTRFYRRRGD